MSQRSVSPQTAPPRLHFRVPPEPAHLLRARERLRDYLRQYCAERQVVDDLVLCVEEACTNAIRHSGTGDDIEISLEFDANRLVAVVKDRGRGFDVANFDPQRSPDPTLDHGRGLFIIAALMDSLELRLDGGLVVTMERRAEPRCDPALLESGLGHRDARTRATLEEIDEAFFALDWQYRHVHVNEMAVRFTQKSRDELLGRTPWEVISELQGSVLAEHYREAMELGKPSVFEHRWVSGGDWLEARIYPTSTGISVYVREINERKRIEQEVVATRAELAATLAAMTDGFYALDRAWRVTYLNDKAAAVFPSGKAALGANFWELFPEDVGSAFEACKRRAMEQGEVCSFEFYYPPLDTWFEERDYPSADGITVLFADIGERKRVEEARERLAREVAAEREQLRTVLETMTEGLVISDAATNVLHMNPEALRIHGFDSVEQVRRGLARWPESELHMLDGRPLPPADSALARVTRGETFEGYEYEVRNKATGTAWIGSFGGAPIRDEAGHVVLTVLTMRDVTDRHRADEERQHLLEASQAQAEELQVKNGELQAQGVEIQNQTEELVVQRDELHHRLEEIEALMDLVPAAVWVASDPGCHEITGNRLANRFYEAMEGENVSAGPEPGKTVGPRRFFADDRELRADELPMQQASARDEEVRDSEFDVELPSGQRRTLWGSASPLHGPDGQVRGCIAAFMDVSERKQAEEALRRSEEAARQAEERYHNLFNTMIEGFCVIEVVFDAAGRSVDYRFLEINPVFEERTGLHDAQGKLMRELAPDHEEQWFEIYGKVALTGEPARFMAPAAALGRYYDVSAFRVGGPQSREVGILFDDITERHGAEQESQRLLEESQAQAEELQAQNEELQAQSEEMQVQNEELGAQRDTIVHESELRAGLNAIAALLNSTFESDEVIRRTLGEATRALGVDAAAIELREGDAWPVRYAEGLPTDELGRPLLGEPVIARSVALSGEALVVDDAAEHETVGPFAKRHGIRSLMAVPLIARRELLGVLLIVERRAVRHFEPAEVDFARRLGITVGLSLENARLFEDRLAAEQLATSELRNADLLLKSAKLLASGLDLQTVLDTLAEVVLEALPHTRVTVQSWDAARRELTITTSRGSHPAREGTTIAFDETSSAFREMLARKTTTVTDFDALPAADHGRIDEFASHLHLGVPLVAGGELIGLLVVDDPGERRPFAEREVALLEAIAAHAATAVENARVFAAQRRIAESLQQNFIHELPEVAGLELGVVAKTASEPELVGGDFSDVFIVDDTHVVALIGDVAGKGVRAAGMTETVRSTVRALAAVDPSPAFILAKTNELLLRFDPDEPHVTAFLAVLDPHTGHLSYASAGHPAPVHLGALSCRPLALTYGPPLGSFERPYTIAHAMLAPEDYLVLYTDGVTEARHDDELFGEDRLIDVVCGLHGGSAQEAAEAVRDAASDFAGSLHDDLEVVVVRLALRATGPCERGTSSKDSIG